jgi:hypothetical protein
MAGDVALECTTHRGHGHGLSDTGTISLDVVGI